MIHIKRSPEPERLTKHGAGWRDSYLEKLQSHTSGSKPRPHGNQYGHDEIHDALRLMSSDKCFYCEQRLDGKGEVEHFVEVAVKPELAFEWTNLYLSCRGCNSAKKSLNITMSDCLDPCNDEQDPSDHLTFDDEFVRSRTDSILGHNSVAKYDLNRGELLYKRSKHLHRFERRMRELYKKGKRLSTAQKAYISGFASPEHEFSLMFRVYLDVNEP